MPHAWFLALTLAVPSHASTSTTPARTTAAPAARPLVEVAFVLDTTGSMGGLLEGAKRRIWTIARRIGEGRPRPELRVALVGYRDRGDEYVARVHDFSADMDEVYARLSDFQAQGGGDTPEHVSAALGAALGQLRWSRDSLKLLFLVGDAPPHTDYADGDYRPHVSAARQRGIAVMTIGCGGDQAMDQAFREIARLAGGEHANIDAGGGMPAQVTPHDADLARLNAQLGATVVAGGSAEERRRTENKLAARGGMAAPAAAEAAGYYAGAARLADKDLVDLPEAEQRRELQALARTPEELPSELRGKDTAAALAELRQRRRQRQELQARILDLTRRREDWLTRQRPAADGFDARVIAFVRRQAQERGIGY